MISEMLALYFNNCGNLYHFLNAITKKWLSSALYCKMAFPLWIRVKVASIEFPTRNAQQKDFDKLTL